MRKFFFISLMFLALGAQASIHDGLEENEQGALMGAIKELLLKGSSPDAPEVRELQSQLDNLTEDLVLAGSFDKVAKPKKLLKMSQANNP